MSFGVCVMKKTPTPFERMSRTVCTTASRKASVASAKSRCASSKKNTSFGFGTSPTSGSCSNSSARSHMRTVENSFGLSCTAGSSRHEMIPRPSESTRRRSAMSSCGSPKNSVPPPSSSWTSLRSSTPIVADETPPIPLRSALPSSESRKERSARRSARSRIGRPFSSAYRKTSERLPSWVSFASRIFASSSGPKSDTVARTGTPGPIPPRERNSVGKPCGSHSCPSSAARFSAGPPGSPG